VHRDERVDIDGNGFSAIGRLALQEILQKLCRDAGVKIEYGRGVTALDQLADADIVVGADGSNSFVRAALQARFQPKIELLTNRFAWYGTTRPFDCLTLTFRGNEHGAFVAHHYRHARSMSTFVVECDEATWHKAGLGRMDDAQSRAYCEGVFAPDLDGHPWSRTSRSAAVSVVIQPDLVLGKVRPDRGRPAHGAFLHWLGNPPRVEDAIALDRAFGETGADVPRALAASSASADRSWKNFSLQRTRVRTGTSAFRKRCARRPGGSPTTT